MGFSSYSTEDRSVKATAKGYYSKSMDQVFEQNAKRMIHESMNPRGAVLRESCDSETHPKTVPLQLWLDVTGSMRKIPHEMIKDGLPTLIGTLIQNGVKDTALMFGAIGDHECDRYPLQVAQFESGDDELDMWLERTYLEGGGGGNAGESYLLAWYYSAFHTRTDAFDKRGKKGYVFTIGDEPTLTKLPMAAVKELMGEEAVGQATWTVDQLLAEVQKKNHVYHIHVSHHYGDEDVIKGWKKILGERVIVVKDHKDIPATISKLILSIEENDIPVKTAEPSVAVITTTGEIIL